LQITDVPEEIRDALAQMARERGQSLQAFLLALVEREARFARNLAVLSWFDGRTDGATEPQAAIEALDHARAAQDARNGGVG
jgi:hypothetical protein